MLFQIHIPRRNTKCQIGQEPIASKMEYHSVLYEDGEDNYRRVDYCTTCWEKADQEQILKDACTHWKSTVPEKLQEDEKTRNRNERALEMLREGLETGDPQKNLILAMFLQRKKILIYRQEITREDGTIYLLYEVNGTDEVLPVQKVSVTDVNTAKLQEEIVKSLSYG